MHELRIFLGNSLTPDWVISASIITGFSFMLISWLAYQAYKAYQLELNGPIPQKPGVLNRYSPNHAVSADIFRAKPKADMGFYLRLVLAAYKVVVVSFYAMIVFDLIYFLWVRNLLALPLS